MTSRTRLVLAGIVAACSVGPFAALASADAPIVAQSLGVHYDEARFSSLLARPDGGLLAIEGRRLHAYLGSGATDPDVASVTAANLGGALFPAADGRTFVVDYRRLTRLDPDGKVDGGFGEAGTVRLPIAAEAVYELGSGRILVLGTRQGNGKFYFAQVDVAVLNADGSLVRRSRQKRSVNAATAPEVVEVAAAPDGGALVAGPDFLLEFDRDGSFRQSFGDGGVVDEPPGIAGAHVLADGGVVVAGSTSDIGTGPGELTVYRLDGGDRPDASSAPDGGRSFDLEGEYEARVASWGADGSVILGGRTVLRACSGEGICEAPFLAAFDAAGELEATFGEGGVLRPLPPVSDRDGSSSRGVTAIARRPDGSVVAAGNAAPRGTTGFLAAVSPSGSLLPDFGEAGIASSPAPRPASLHLAGFTVLPEGKILGVGRSDIGLGPHAVMVRYLPDGSLDRSFGDGAGYVTFHTAGGLPFGASGFAVAAGEVLTTVHVSPTKDLLLALDEDDGSPVASFGSDGAVGYPRGVTPTAVALGEDGDPVVLGNDGRTHFRQSPGVVLRYLPDGRPDRAFAHGGRFTMRLGNQAVGGEAVAADPGGRILAAGRIRQGFAIVHLLADGRPDPRFGSAGWAVAKVGARARDLALARVGRHIYLAGTFGGYGAEPRLVLLRFDRRGRLDRGFGHDGRTVVPLGKAGGARQILPTPDGVLVVLGDGVRPLLNFTRGGRLAHRRALTKKTSSAVDVRASVSEGGLVVGWGAEDRASGSIDYHFSRPPLGPRRASVQDLR